MSISDLLSQLNSRYFQGLEGQYRFEIEFLLRKCGLNETLAEVPGAPHSDRESANCEIHLEPGTYEVLTKVIAERSNLGKAVEKVVQIHADKNPKKLRQIGMQYDLAHAKVGVLDEDAELERKKEKEKKRNKKPRRQQQEKMREMSDAMARMQLAINSMEQELNKKGKQKEREKEGDAEGQKSEHQAQKGEKRDNAKSPTSKGYSPPGFWPGESFKSNAQPSEAAGEAAGEAHRPAEDSNKEEKEGSNAPDTTPKPRIQRRTTSGLTGNGRTQDVPNPSPSPGPVPPPQPNPEPQLEPQPQVADSNELVSGSDSDSETDSEADSSDSGSDIGEIADNRNPPWNAVCVLGLRVYAQDKDISATLVGETPAETKPSKEEIKDEEKKVETPKKEAKA